MENKEVKDILPLETIVVLKNVVSGLLNYDWICH